MGYRLGASTLAVLSGILVIHAAARGNTAPYDRDQALAISQGAIGGQVGDHQFLNRQGQPFSLSQLRGRPLLISLIYTSCYHICPVLTGHLAKNVVIARDALGEDSFSVVTIGFDTAVDTADRMRQFAAERGIDIRGWYFLSGDASTIEALSAELGFIYYPSPKGFDHLSQITVVDAGGKVYSQVYGQQFPVPALVEPLKELVFDTPAHAGLVASWLNGVRLFCTIYDPSRGRYRFDYSIIVGIFVGLICLGAVVVFIIRSWREAV